MNWLIPILYTRQNKILFYFFFKKSKNKQQTKWGFGDVYDETNIGVGKKIEKPEKKEKPKNQKIAEKIERIKI